MRRSNMFPRTLLPLFVLLLFGCRDDATGPATYEVDYQLIVIPAEISLMAGQTFQFSVMVQDDQGRLLPLPPGDEVTWGSSDPVVAKVADDGTVLALAEGGVNITAGCNGQRAWANVRVVGYLPPGR